MQSDWDRQPTDDHSHLYSFSRRSEPFPAQCMQGLQRSRAKDIKFTLWLHRIKINPWFPQEYGLLTHIVQYFNQSSLWNLLSCTVKEVLNAGRPENVLFNHISLFRSYKISFFDRSKWCFSTLEHVAGGVSCSCTSCNVLKPKHNEHKKDISHRAGQRCLANLFYQNHGSYSQQRDGPTGALSCGVCNLQRELFSFLKVWRKYIC